METLGERSAREEVQRDDMISAIKFDHSGDHLATGDRGGRVVLFERSDAKHSSGARKDLEKREYPVRHPEFCYKTEFQSHDHTFDYLNSLEIEEKINKIRWCQIANGALYLLSTANLCTMLIITTAGILAVIFTVAKTFDPLPEDILSYHLKQPFNLQKGWFVWGGIGLAGAVGGIALTGVALSLFSTEIPKREVDSLMQLLPLIEFSNISTSSLVGITGFLAPPLKEMCSAGFFMVSLTKWVPTPIAIIIGSAAFSLAHLTPGSVLGLTYAQTRNLITPMVIHGFWISGVLLLLNFLQVQVYDIKELLQAS